MYNFEYTNPVKIIFGKESISRLKNEIPQGSRVLMLYGGGSIKGNGVYQQVKASLKDFDHLEFAGIEPNPRYETCMKAIEMVRRENIDFLLAVGGGSVIDATKFVAAGALYSGDDPWDFFSQRYIIEPEDALPIGAVLTLPATGSEMNGNTVVTRESTREKLSFGSPKVLPGFSILDPVTVFSLPDKQVANGVVDAFIHVMEQYLTFPVNAPLQDRFAESILQTLIEEGPKVLGNRQDYDAAANFMWSATLALNGLIATGVPQDWSTHLIGHELTAFHGIDHARTLAVVLPGVMNLKRKSKQDKILQFGERIWGIKEGTIDERIDQTISRTVSFFESLGVPCRLSEYGVPEETIRKISERFKKRGSKLGEKEDIDYSQVEKILFDRM
ncbi:MAG: iron-containing alcohol dehydrogenase [Mariniphaga sp.]|nr:iron-containing alcohol dehydrogenase [Mariniphaga sp.]MDD4225273.1 iron-containing alcohol dehydrogenase [Mariniphaga sp.]MDD4424847.1 iron-containing alcohol dehydrogenase [Mariniphaga sp.]